MSEIAFLYMTPEDAPAVYEIMQTISAQSERKDLYVTDGLPFITECITRRGFGVKAVHGGNMVGFLLVYFPSVAEPGHLGHALKLEEEERKRVAYMDSAAVLPKYRGRGLQRRLIQFAERSGRLCGYRYLMATVSPDNRYSLRNLQALGYGIVCSGERYGGLARYVVCKLADSPVGRRRL